MASSLALLALAGSAGAHEVVSGSLRTLMMRRPFALQSHVRGAFHRQLTNPAALLHVRMEHALSGSEIAALRLAGMDFVTRPGSAIASHVGRIYAARVAWDRIEALAHDRRILRMTPAQKPHTKLPLDKSAGLVQARDCWAAAEVQGDPMTGRGITVLDLDTGVDIHHPALWRAGTQRFAWIDVNGNGVFDPGIDAIDFDGNGIAKPNATLAVMKSPVGTFGWQDGQAVLENPTTAPFRSDLDYLYNDANHDGARNHGAGFTESDPGYGEQMFIVEAADGTLRPNRDLRADDLLVPLVTSKIAGILGLDGTTEHMRGTDLIGAQPDVEGHGTGVIGILASGWIDDFGGAGRFTGIAPDADILVAPTTAPGTRVTVVTAVDWGERHGARIILYEYGRWWSEFLDGSSAEEEVVATAEADGLVQVAAAGNLANGQKHARIVTGPAGHLGLQVPAVSPNPIGSMSASLLWRTSATMTVSITAPGLAAIALPAPGQTVQGGIACSRADDVSPRGTMRIDLQCYGWDGRQYLALPLGAWAIDIVSSASNVQVDAFVDDDRTSWGGGITFTADVTNAMTVTAPATSDGALRVASYVTRGIFGGRIGDLSDFSGRGPRIDGASDVDIAAPGHFDVFSATTARTGAWALFGGTSAAAPHVAGAVALLLEADPTLTPPEVTGAIRAGAGTDLVTRAGSVDGWGAGKLHVFDAHVYPAGPAPRFTIAALPNPVAKEIVTLIAAPSRQLGAAPSIRVDGQTRTVTPGGLSTWRASVLRGSGAMSVHIDGIDLHGTAGSGDAVIP